MGRQLEKVVHTSKYLWTSKHLIKEEKKARCHLLTHKECLTISGCFGLILSSPRKMESWESSSVLIWLESGFGFWRVFWFVCFFFFPKKVLKWSRKAWNELSLCKKKQPKTSSLVNKNRNFWKTFIYKYLYNATLISPLTCYVFLFSSCLLYPPRQCISLQGLSASVFAHSPDCFKKQNFSERFKRIEQFNTE